MAKRKGLTKKGLKQKTRMRVGKNALDLMYDWSMKKATKEARVGKNKTQKKRMRDIKSHQYGNTVLRCASEIAKVSDRKTIKKKDVMACTRILK